MAARSATSDPNTGNTQQVNRFVWPPRTPVEVEISPALTEPAPPRPQPTPRRERPREITIDSTRSWLSHIEHTWLDTLAPPLHERMVTENWMPDVVGDYCPMCAETVGRHDLTESRCPACRNTRPPWERIIRLGPYEHPLRHWIHEVKFTRWRRLGTDLGKLLGESIAVQLAASRAADPDAFPAPPLIVPVPTPLRRLMLRGIDHSRVLARGIAARVGGRVVQPLAREHRPSQLNVAPSRRAANIAGAFRPKAPWRRPDLSGRLVIVVDDVTTTGATLRAACRAVGLCGVGTQRPRIWAAVLAKTPAGESLQTVT